MVIVGAIIINDISIPLALVLSLFSLLFLIEILLLLLLLLSSSSLLWGTYNPQPTVIFSTNSVLYVM